MAYKSRDYILPRLPAHDSAAWALHDRLAKQAADEREALRAEAERKAAVEAANAERAVADKATAEKLNTTPVRHGVSAHFD